jgi:hypothetical protein
MKKTVLLAILFCLSISIFAQENFDVIKIDGEDCGLHGNAKAKREYDQNPFKNRWNFPDKNKIDGSITLAKFIEGGDDRDRFNQNQAVEITGYVYAVKIGGVETCNCKTKNQLFRDTHIELTPNAEETSPDKRVIVEVTPRIRQILEKQGVDWSTATLKDKDGSMGILHKTIKVQGWLFYDFSHETDAFSYDPEDKIGGEKRKNWRASCWEVHPITNIEILDPSEEEFPIGSVENSSAPKFYTSSVFPGSTPPKTTKSMTAADYLTLILLGGILGMVGQGIRVIVGIKKVNDAKDSDNPLKYQRTIMSLFIAFSIGGIAGVLAAIGSMEAPIDKATIIAFLTAGYAGTDFIEGFMMKNKQK